MNYIYAIKNLINNKMYIGSTVSPKNRKYEHFRSLTKGKHHSPHLQKSYDKYGKDKFAFYILEECNPEDRKQRELDFIKFYNTFNKEFGYNIYEPDGSKFKCAESTKDKIKKTKEGKSNTSIDIPIDIYKIDGTFIVSLSHLTQCKKYGIPPTCVRGILDGKRKSHKGLTIVHKGEPFSYTPSTKQRDMSKFYKK